MNITLWHGGRDLEYNYREYSGSKKGRWEHGPGLYLTTHYDRARQYSKGNGSTYKVNVECNNNIKDVIIPVEAINEFINRHVIKSKQKELLEDVYSNIERMKRPGIIAENFLNLIINLNAIQNTNTIVLNKFLVEHNVDYGLVKRYGGREEDVVIIFNNKCIKSVNKITAKDVIKDDYEIIIFNEDKSNIKKSI